MTGDRTISIVHTHMYCVSRRVRIHNAVSLTLAMLYRTNINLCVMQQDYSDSREQIEAYGDSKQHQFGIAPTMWTLTNIHD